MYFEDFDLETVHTTQRLKITEDMILGYALLYDPQPFHLDPEHPQSKALGGLFASGFQALAFSLRLMNDQGLFGHNLIGLGLDKVRWHKPLLAGSTIYAQNRALELRGSRSKPNQGIVTVETRLFDQNDTLLMTSELSFMVQRREITIENKTDFPR